MARAKQPTKTIQQMTIPEWEAAFPDEDACCAYLVGHRWPDSVACPRCGNVKVFPVSTRPWNWQCYECGPGGESHRFSHIVGTIFENTNKSLREWFRVIHLMLTSKKGISALQVHRMMGFGSYRTAWYMCHRVRAGLANEDFRKLMGIVEVDETFGTSTSAGRAAELVVPAPAKSRLSVPSSARARSSRGLSAASMVQPSPLSCAAQSPRKSA
jgi:hypothetical protein